jgi:hypothetical protein
MFKEEIKKKTHTFHTVMLYNGVDIYKEFSRGNPEKTQDLHNPLKS